MAGEAKRVPPAVRQRQASAEAEDRDLSPLALCLVAVGEAAAVRPSDPQAAIHGLQRDAPLSAGDSGAAPDGGSEKIHMTQAHSAMLQRADPRCVFVVRGVGQMGFSSAEMLVSHFSRHGRVARVFLALSTLASDDGLHLHVRPADVGFVVVDSPDVVGRVLAAAEHLVGGHRVLVQRFATSLKPSSGSSSSVASMSTDTGGSSASVATPCGATDSRREAEGEGDGAEDDAAASTVQSHLEQLQGEDRSCVFVARRINRMGGHSADVLAQHYSRYGRVLRVHVPQRGRVKAKTSNRQQLRVQPCNLGFVVMEDAASVARVLADGAEQVVCGVDICVQPFKGAAPPAPPSQLGGGPPATGLANAGTFGARQRPARN